MKYSLFGLFGWVWAEDRISFGGHWRFGCELPTIRNYFESQIPWTHMWEENARVEREKGKLFPGVGLHLPLCAVSPLCKPHFDIYSCVRLCVLCMDADADTETTNNTSGNPIARHWGKRTGHGSNWKCELRYKMVNVILSVSFCLLEIWISPFIQLC